MTPGENVNELNKKLHNQWIETQGRKPNKVKKQNRRASAEPIEDEDEYESEKAEEKEEPEEVEAD